MPFSILTRICGLSKKWKIFTAMMFFSAIMGLLILLFWPGYQGLVILFFYTIPANSFIPVPHEPTMMYYGSIYNPVLASILAGIATCIAAFVDYQVLTRAFNFKKLREFKEKRFYQQVESHFNKMPFVSIIIAAFTPIPYYPFRVLAVASGYSIKLYILANFIGRTPRYYIEALIARGLKFPDWVYLVIFAALVGLSLIGKFISAARKRVKLFRQNAGFNNKV